jgi:ribosomal protein S18 acetylase RimI-like enzyme
VPLWQAFAQSRLEADPSLALRPNFDFKTYVARQLQKPLTFCWVLEHEAESETQIVGFFAAYCYDEGPPADLPPELLEQHLLEQPFEPRRVGSVLALYLDPNHRDPRNVKRLVLAGMAMAREQKLSHIDLHIFTHLTGHQALLERMGFVKSALNYTYTFDLARETTLPSLHPPRPDLATASPPPAPGAIPLRDPKHQGIVHSPGGEPVFLHPVQDDAGNLLTTSRGLAIYPSPVRHPRTRDWVFDGDHNLVVCPVLRTDTGEVVEYEGIPVFHPPRYEHLNGELDLKKDEAGNPVFCQVEVNKQGEMLRSPTGQPIFQLALA